MPLLDLATGSRQWALDRWASKHHYRNSNRFKTQQHVSPPAQSRNHEHNYITPVLRQLPWLPMEYHVQYKIILLTYKALQGQALSYLSDLLQPHTSARAVRSSMRDDLWVPRTKLRTYGDQAFSFVAPRLWNSLLLGLRQTSSSADFRKQLKTHTFGLAFLRN